MMITLPISDGMISSKLIVQNRKVRNTHSVLRTVIQTGLFALVLILISGLSSRSWRFDYSFGSKRYLQHFIHVFDRNDLQFRLGSFRQIDQILEILFRQ